MTCVFLFYFKIFNPLLYIPSNDTGCSVGLRQPMKSIFEPEEDLNYFDKFMHFKHKTGFLSYVSNLDGP